MDLLECNEVIVWSKNTCPFCDKAKTLLNELDIPYEERILGKNWDKNDLLKILPNARTVPQIFIDNVHVGGYTELEALKEKLEKVMYDKKNKRKEHR